MGFWGGAGQPIRSYKLLNIILKQPFGTSPSLMAGKEGKEKVKKKLLHTALRNILFNFHTTCKTNVNKWGALSSWAEIAAMLEIPVVVAASVKCHIRPRQQPQRKELMLIIMHWCCHTACCDENLFQHRFRLKRNFQVYNKINLPEAQ